MEWIEYWNCWAARAVSQAVLRAHAKPDDNWPQAERRDDRHGGLWIEHTNSATSRALPLSDSLCTLEVSFSFLLGFSEVAIVVVRVGREMILGP